MDFFHVVKERCSIRSFKDQPVEEDKIRRILEAANAAPSAGNLQAYEILLIKNRRLREELARAALHQSFIAEAPVVLVFCAHPARSSPRYGRRGEELYSLQDATIAAAHAHLAATALGLGSVWIGAFDDLGVRRVLGNPPGLRPIAILPIGYPAERPIPTGRRRLKDIVHEVR